MPPPNHRSTLFGALLLSAVLHGLLLSLPIDLRVQPAGRPAVGAVKVYLPLRATLRSATVQQDPIPWFSPQSEERVTAPPERQASAEELPAPPPGQQGAGSPSAIGYFPFKALSKEPEAIGEFLPKLPALPGGLTGKGKLTIRIWINPAGSIDRVELLTGDMTYAYRQAMLDAFSKMTFKPGEINHLPVGTWADVVIDFPAAPAERPQ
ncbi:MAG TPA: hypothetical protein VI279_16680 [Rhodocyclaceae bacterium]